MIEDFDVSLKATNPNEKLDVEHVLTLANHFQRKYGLHYLRDIIQQDRSKLPLLFNGVGISKSEVANNDGLIHEANLINKSFKYIENFFQENGEIDFVLIRPADYSRQSRFALFAMPKKFQFLFFHGSYFNLGAQWSAGPYMGNKIIDYIFRNTKLGNDVIHQDTTPVQQWKAPKKPNLRSLCKTLIRFLGIALSFLFLMLKHVILVLGALRFLIMSETKLIAIESKFFWIGLPNKISAN